MTPREWAARPSSERLTRSQWQWLFRHGLWIALLVVVTTWEALGFIFPVAAKVPEWWDHPTISQEIKAIIGTSLPGRIVASVVIAMLGVVLTLHWAWRVPG